MPVLRRAAIAQLCSSSNKLSNLVDVAKCAGWAKKEGASMLFLPECFGFMGESSDQTVLNAEPPLEEEHGDASDRSVPSRNDETVSTALASIVSFHANGVDGKVESFTNDDEVANAGKEGGISILDGLRTIARESGLWISGGGMHESGAPPADLTDERDGTETAMSRPRVYNTHVIIDDLGDSQCVYRKVHLFDVFIPDKVNLQESKNTAPGKKLAVCDSPIGRLGLSTCYDIRFPEMYVELVQKGGAQILLVPSAFTVITGNAHWHALLRARAIENQCYVLAAAQYGRHNVKRESYGHSLAVDPWGKILADAGGYDGVGAIRPDEHGAAQSDESTVDTPSIIICDIDLDKLDSIRERMPIQQHRSSSLFSF